MQKGFLVVGLNPTIQNTYSFDSLQISQVNRVRAHRLDLAGKGGNTSRVLVQLGERAIHLTFCGGLNAKLYRKLTEAESIELRVPDAEGDIRFCHTLLDRNSGAATEIVEPGSRIVPELENALLAEFREALADAHTLVIGGSKAPGFRADLYSIMVREAHGAGLTTVLDIRGNDLLSCMQHGPAAIKINVSEFAQTFLPDQELPEETSPGDLPDALFEKMISLRREHGTDVVLTNGSHPALYVDEDSVQTASVAPARLINPIGSGDAFTAGYAAGLFRTGKVRDAIQLGLECARSNVSLEKPGSIR